MISVDFSIFGAEVVLQAPEAMLSNESRDQWFVTDDTPEDGKGPLANLPKILGRRGAALKNARDTPTVDQEYYQKASGGGHLELVRVGQDQYYFSDPEESSDGYSDFSIEI